MGTNKAWLRLGEETFLERLLSRLSVFPEVLISAAGEAEYARLGFPVIADVYPGTGPLGGLYSALKFCRSSYLLALGCDKPLFETALGIYLADRAPGFDAVVPVTQDGRIQPLCAVYAKSCGEILLGQIKSENYRLTAALKKMRTLYIPLSQTSFSDRLLANINTPEDYSQLLGSGRPMHYPLR
jgi:molybdopterin-guanine dinucleotide biosynthesis protein A